MEEIKAEEIIRMRRELEELPSGEEALYEIENGDQNGWVIIKYEKAVLEERKILDGKASMLLPTTFIEMPDEWKMVKYPDPDRPKWILCDEDGEVTLTMQVEEGEVNEGELEKICEMIERQMLRMHPSSPIEGKETMGEGRSKVCWFSQDIPLVDDVCCHMMFFREVEEGLLLGTLGCAVENKKDWRGIARRLLKTIKEPSEEDGADEKG